MRLSTLFEYLAGRLFVPSVRKLRECDPSEGLPLVDHVWAMIGFERDEADDLERWVYDHRLSGPAKECYDANRTYPGANQRVWLEHYYDVLEQTRFASCWLKSATESAAMWQLYGTAGAAVRSNPQKLGVALSASGRRWLISGIKYLDRNEPAWMEFGWGDEGAKPWIRRPFLVKRAEYSHEQEVRLVTVCEDGLDSITLTGLDPAQWIEEIVFWPRFPRSECSSLISAVDKICPALKGRVRPSRLFSRDPTSSPSPELEDALDELFAEGSRKAAKEMPSFLRDP